MSAQEDLLALTYTLIYHFLISKDHLKAAKSLRKAAKPVVDVKKSENPSKELLSLVQDWKASITSVESSDEDSSSDEDDQEEDQQAVAVSGVSIEQESESSSEEEAPPSAKAPTPVKSEGKGSKSKKRKRSEAAADVVPNGNHAKADSTASPSEVMTQKRAADLVPEPSTLADDPPMKKARIEPDGTLDGLSASPEPKAKGGRKPNVPFSRIKPEEVTFHDPRLKNNAFESRAGAPVNDYGAKASKDLIVTRGAGFRKEKNKKKRGSYHGGEITLQSHSIKFD